MNRRKMTRHAPVAPTNTTLLKLLEAGSRDPQTDRSPLLHELQTAVLLVPILEPAPVTQAGRAADLKLAVLERNGGRALVGFTDADALRRFAPARSLPYAALAVAELCRLAWQGQFFALVLNPGGPYGYEMSALEIAGIAEGLTPGEDNAMTVGRETAAFVGMPKERPSDETLQAMREVLQEAGAQEAYWFQIVLKGGKPHLGLAVAPGDTTLIQRVGAAIEPIWKAARPDNAVFDIIPLGDKELSHAARTSGEKLV